MSDFTERRMYKRCTNTICRTGMSPEGTHWVTVDLQDISAGGLNFQSDSVYEVGQKLFFDLQVYYAFSEFNLRFEGEIIYHRKEESGNHYGVKFVNVDNYYQIQLDEIIRTKMNIADKISHCHHAHEEGSYTFILRPRVNRIKRNIML